MTIAKEIATDFRSKKTSIVDMTLEILSGITIFHEQLCGDARILTPEIWRGFHQSRSLVMVLENEPAEEERNVERRR